MDLITAYGIAVRNVSPLTHWKITAGLRLVLLWFYDSGKRTFQDIVQFDKVISALFPFSQTIYRGKLSSWGEDFPSNCSVVFGFRNAQKQFFIPQERDYTDACRLVESVIYL